AICSKNGREQTRYRGSVGRCAALDGKERRLLTHFRRSDLSVPSDITTRCRPIRDKRSPPYRLCAAGNAGSRENYMKTRITLATLIAALFAATSLVACDRGQ